MEHFLGFTRRHWMPPSGKRLCFIAMAADMVDNVVVKHKTLTKIFLAC